MSVATRFNAFLGNLTLTDSQIADGKARTESVISVLNKQYWNSTSGSSNSVNVGSWAKFTRIRPPRDVDVLIELPASVHTRFEGRTGNRQSQLLQEVRSTLSKAFLNTAIKGDGPAVIVPFSTYCVELIPSFQLSGGGHWVCMTDNGGHYKKADYSAEASAILHSNETTNGNTRHLVRMMKRWQAHCSVSLKSFHIEITVMDFLKTWGNAGKSATYYDWMVRDYLAYLVGRENKWINAPGTGEAMYLGSAWVSRAESALSRAKNACIYEASNDSSNAGDEWQKIFGSDIPKYV